MKFDFAIQPVDEEAQRRREMPVTLTISLSEEDRAEMQQRVNERCRSAWAVVKRRGRWAVAHTSLFYGTVELLSVRREDGAIVPWQWPSRAAAETFLEETFAAPMQDYSLLGLCLRSAPGR